MNVERHYAFSTSDLELIQSALVAYRRSLGKFLDFNLHTDYVKSIHSRTMEALEEVERLEQRIADELH